MHWKCAELRTPPPPYPAFGGRFQVLVAGLVARGGVWLWGVVCEAAAAVMMRGVCACMAVWVWVCLCLVVCVSSLNIRRFVIWLSRRGFRSSCLLIPVASDSRRAGRGPASATADAAGRRTSPPAGRAAGWSSVRGSEPSADGAVASGSVRAAAGHARPPPAPNARRRGRGRLRRQAGRRGGRRRRAARSCTSRTGLTGASAPRGRSPIAPRERETRDIVGSSTKYAVRRFDNRHIHDKQTSRIMMRIESIEA